ncbi:transcription-repair coupling factor [Chloroflexota bacterium]
MVLDLTRLLQLIDEVPAYRQLTDGLQQSNSRNSITVLNAAKPYVIAALYRSLHIPMLVVTAQPENCRKLYEQVLTWCNSPMIKLFPEPDALPYEQIVSDTTTESERLQSFSVLANYSDSDVPLVITSAPALMGKVALHSEFTAASHTIKTGMSIDPLELLKRWQAIGYLVENTVDIPGIISHRGGIIDIYPITSDLPARLEFMGNTIESIRLFDPRTQLSTRSVLSINIYPATEVLLPSGDNGRVSEQIANTLDLSTCNPEASQIFEQEMAMLAEGQRPKNIQFYAPLFNNDSLLDYLPPNCLLVLDEPSSIKNTVEDLDDEAEQLRSDMLEQGELPANFPVPYFTWRELESKLEIKQRLAISSWGFTDENQNYYLDLKSTPTYAGQVPGFIRDTRRWLSQKHRLIVTSYQASRLSELLQEEGIFIEPVTEIIEAPPPGSLTLIQGSLDEGWSMNDNVHLLTDAEIFGFIKQRRLSKKRPVPHHKLAIDFTPDDYVVHIEHGIARFAGITAMKVDDTEKEYLVLLYASNDKLYVPTDQIDRVTRYVGSGERPPVINRLGTQEWTQIKRRVKESSENLARELLALYAAREVVPGYSFSRDTVWQQEMESSFTYIETPDQIEAQQHVKEDMEKDKPMDRLICGDVGYGKTEIAIRAAFKAVMDSKQVAVLVPTTVLAQQHFVTFSQRLAAFPIRIESLSRFRSPKEQQTILEGLADGNVDICIGTHRLLQKDVVFKNLGLLIIDEEQRFGVAHKEHLKQLRMDADILTLSATPIPRTLHMSLVGVRDMSTMETPPEERLPIKTFVAEYDERLVREAILRELERNGQVFFVHNRVQSIVLAASKLRDLVPEAKIAIAHGQMPEEDMESVMIDFVQGKSDVLVCTTIIESGMDMPNANTMIINNADRFGLTQLYQLRGRVGRGANLAYAYFLFEKGKHLTPTAEKRLRTIYEATELGAGFGIAMKDLEIRGAGTLLGTKQSGQISAVGFSLYCRLLADAVEEQKARLAGKPEKAIKRLPPPTVDLPLSALIPEDYVADLDTRLSLYQKLAGLQTIEQVDTLSREFNDRFGTLPKEINNLLYAVRIKLLAADAGIESISHEHGQIVLRLHEGLKFDKQKLAPLLRDEIKVGITQLRLNTRRLGGGWQRILEDILNHLS